MGAFIPQELSGLFFRLSCRRVTRMLLLHQQNNPKLYRIRTDSSGLKNQARQGSNLHSWFTCGRSKTQQLLLPMIHRKVPASRYSNHIGCHVDASSNSATCSNPIFYSPVD